MATRFRQVGALSTAVGPTKLLCQPTRLVLSSLITVCALPSTDYPWCGFNTSLVNPMTILLAYPYLVCAGPLRVSHISQHGGTGAVLLPTATSPLQSVFSCR